MSIFDASGLQTQANSTSGTVQTMNNTPMCDDAGKRFTDLQATHLKNNKTNIIFGYQ